MPTNIIGVSAPIDNTGAVWDDIGQGAQGLGQMLASAYAAKGASDAANVAKGQDALKSVGLTPNGTPPGGVPYPEVKLATSIGQLPPSILNAPNPAFHPQPATPGGGLSMGGGGGAGFQSSFASQFPSLFGGSGQYGGF